MAAIASMRKALREADWFNLTPCRTACTLVSNWPATEEWRVIESLHCVKWADMGPELERMVKTICAEVVGLTVDELLPPPPASAPHLPKPAPQPPGVYGRLLQIIGAQRTAWQGR